VARLGWRWRHLEWQHELAVEAGNDLAAVALQHRVADARRLLDLERLYRP
jgi:hypothetical protein